MLSKVPISGRREVGSRRRTPDCLLAHVVFKSTDFALAHPLRWPNSGAIIPLVTIMFKLA